MVGCGAHQAEYGSNSDHLVDSRMGFPIGGGSSQSAPHICLFLFGRHEATHFPLESLFATGKARTPGSKNENSRFETVETEYFWGSNISSCTAQHLYAQTLFGSSLYFQELAFRSLVSACLANNLVIKYEPLGSVMLGEALG